MRALLHSTPAWAVIVAAAAARALFLALAPPDAVSTDLSQNWSTVVAHLENGANPYVTTTYLNWPPVWLQVLYGLRQLSVATGLSWYRAVQLFTASADVATVAAAALTLGTTVARRRGLLFGFALNPASILVSCQHCNFDSLVALWAVLAVAALASSQRTRDQLDVALGFLALGIGVVTKTVPLVLTALFGGTFWRLPWRGKVLGAALVLGPVTLGMGVIYVLQPAAVTANVLQYRSASGWFGVTGILQMCGLPFEWYSKVFMLLMVAAGVVALLACWREQVDDGRLILSAALLLLFVPTLGPGYGPQYVAWSMPFLALAVGVAQGGLRKLVMAQLVVCAVTLIIEYGLFFSHGQLFFKVTHDPDWLTLGASWSSPGGQTKVRLANFVVSVWVVSWLARHLAKLALGREAAARMS